MICLRCASPRGFKKINGLSLPLSGVPRQSAVAVTGILCDRCNLLILEMNPSAVPVEVIEPLPDSEPGRN